MSQLLFDAVSNITLRADKSDRKMLCDTFVNVGQLMTILMTLIPQHYYQLNFLST